MLKCITKYYYCSYQCVFHRLARSQRRTFQDCFSSFTQACQSADITALKECIYEHVNKYNIKSYVSQISTFKWSKIFYILSSSFQVQHNRPTWPILSARNKLSVLRLSWPAHSAETNLPKPFYNTSPCTTTNSSYILAVYILYCITYNWVRALVWGLVVEYRTQNWKLDWAGFNVSTNTV